MANEIELKLRITPAAATRLHQHPVVLAASTAPSVTRKLVSIYYDTPDLALMDAGISLRVRRMSGGWFQAVKAAGHASTGLHQRQEWEDIIAFGHPDFSKITEPSLTAIFDRPGLRQALTPIFTTDVRRTEWQLAWDNGDKVELALDRGALVIDATREPISEIELELKAGSTRRLFELALILQQDLKLQLENVSKAQRGYAHYRPTPLAVARAHRTQLKKHLDCRAALRQIVQECIGQLQGNQDMVLHGEDIEGVHQMRVALRRLRSAFSLFRDFMDQAACAPLVEDMRWIAGLLGDARDLDVFIVETLPPMTQSIPDHKGLHALRDRAHSHRAAAYARARSALGSQRYHRFLLSLGAWLEALTPEDDPAPSTEVGTLAAHALGKAHKRLLRHAGADAAGEPETLHARRLAAKKLRYAAEFFASLYPDRKTRPFITSLAKIQGTLGDLNDTLATERLIAHLGGNKPDRSLDEAMHLFRGWNASHTLHRLQAADKAWRRFLKAAPFWRG